MKSIVFLFAILISAQAFGFSSFESDVESFGSDVESAATQFGSDVQSAATQFGSDVESYATQFGSDVQSYADQGGNDIASGFNQFGDQIQSGMQAFGNNVVAAAATFADHIESLPSDMKNQFQYVGQQIQNVAQQGAEIASDVADEIQAAASQVVAEAEQLAQEFNLALECVEAVLENHDLFSQLAEVADEPPKLILYWNSMTDEIFNLCVACSGESESKFEWIKEIQFTKGEQEVISCTSDIIEFAEYAAGLDDGEDEIDPMGIVDLVNSVIAMTQDCPAAIEYIAHQVDSTIPSTVASSADGDDYDSSSEYYPSSSENYPSDFFG